jgi:Fic family protein
MATTVRRRWTPAAGAYGGRRARTSFDYDAYVPDRIADIEPALSSDEASVITEAEVAVRELNHRGPRLGALETLARQLLRAEAVASSRIEGLEMSQRRMALALAAPSDADATARAVLGNVRAMEEAIRLGSTRRPLRPRDILALHRTLLEGTRDGEIAGKLRRSQNWIGGDELSPRNAEFVPPPHELVPDLLSDLCGFAGRDDIPAVAQAAIVHAQFETIHPFADGNGRVGRCLIHVVLRQRGVTPNYVPPVSLILATDARSYVGGLTAYRRGAVGEWSAVFAQALRSAGLRAVEFAERIAALEERWRDAAGRPRAGSAAERIIQMLPAQPVFQVSAAADSAGVVYEAARLAVERLTDAGVVRPLPGRRRGRLYEAPLLFALIDRFEHELATPLGGRRLVRRAPRATPAR